MSEDKSTRIRGLNDLLRKTSQGGQIVMTVGVSQLGKETIRRIAESVQNYNDFSPDNDPYGEHDFGSFEVDGHKLFWKIDYYAHNMMHGSNDASDPEVTKRVLTIMLASEY